MISRIRGILIEREQLANHLQVTIDVHGVGYSLLVPVSDLAGSAIGAEVNLYADLAVREDSMVLYGFTSAARRSLFRSLQTVTGVGPKVALSVISATESDLLITAIVDGDHAFLERLPGIGKKVASRIVLELREKMDLPSGARSKDWRNDLKQGLVNLGYGEREAEGAIREIGEQSDLSSALKAALSHLTAIRR